MSITVQREAEAMTMPLVLWLPGDPVSKGRPRVGNGRTVTPKKTREAEELIRWRLKAAKVRPIDGPVVFTAHYQTATRRRTDLDNLLKLTLDAANGIAFADDSQVEEIHASIDRAHPEPGTWLRIGPKVPA